MGRARTAKGRGATGVRGWEREEVVMGGWEGRMRVAVCVFTVYFFGDLDGRTTGSGALSAAASSTECFR